MQIYHSFKPYYKWITLNTFTKFLRSIRTKRFKPYYKWITLNTIPTGLYTKILQGFKPYYKWITLNTEDVLVVLRAQANVLNLIING